MITPAAMSEKTVAILGMGRSGASAARALVAAGAQVIVHDDRGGAEPPGGAAAAPPEQWPWAELEAVVISPGIPHAFPEPHPAASMADGHGVPVVSDIELLARARPAAKVVGITGTNGKSTTTMLLRHLLEAAGIPAVAGGNIGTPALDLDDPGAGGAIVLELSSYQLETTPSLRLDAGAVTNVTPDHLDRHHGWDGYLAAKMRVAESVTPEGLLVLGGGGELDPFAEACRGRVERVDGAGAPTGGNPALAGPHNAENTAIALALAAGLGAGRGPMEAALASFRGLPHRMERLGTSRGVAFVNDSKATNAEAEGAALRSFPSVYWLAGGVAKEGGLAGAAGAAGGVVRAYLFGESADAFAADLEGSVPHRKAATLEDAFALAAADAEKEGRPDATVLLAPAAASFDQFPDFEARGDAFRRAVEAWAEIPAGGGGARPRTATLAVCPGEARHA